MKNPHTVLRIASRSLYPVVFSTLFIFSAHAQCVTSQQFYSNLIAVEKDTSLPADKKLLRVLALKERFLTCGLQEDSVYARMLHRLGVLYNALGNAGDAINYTKQSIRINTNGKSNANRRMAISSYYNLGNFYLDQHFYKEAMASLDNCIAAGSNLKDSATIIRVSSARQKRGYIFHQWGDDQKDIAETKLGLSGALPFRNNIITLALLNEQAQAYTSAKMIRNAIAALDMAIQYIPAGDYNGIADNYKQRAVILEASGNNRQAMAFYNKAIEARLKSPQKDVTKDYLDVGNFLLHTSPGNAASRSYYRKALAVAQEKHNVEIAGKALNNLGIISAENKQFTTALMECQQGLQAIIPSCTLHDTLQNPLYRQCNAANKILLYLLLSNKADCLLRMFRQVKDKKYVDACIATSLLTDSVITGMRQEQTEEQSKLHWLKDARDVYANALEACYLSGNNTLAFYFMEKSRSVLLNDKLNELGASAILPAADAAREREYLLNIQVAQQKLAALNSADPLFGAQENRYLEAKENFESFTKNLQIKYPAYYQYKYADDVPALEALQKELKAGRQCFVHYFISDTCLYMLATTPDSVTLIRQCTSSVPLLAEFIQLCSDKQALNRNYARFTALSYQLYGLLFRPLALPLKRVIICNDNFLLPFEALVTTPQGNNFLVYRYVFSYAYSARSMMKKAGNLSGDGDCLLVAPGVYAASLHVSNLDESENFIEESGAYYRKTSLLLGSEASKKDFMHLFPRYKIVNIYSHATADSSGAEPLLYMQDSVIRLSELEMLDRPCTRLVVLSACQTSVGRNAAGEGIYSLARGFAAAGIPSIATTLWEADAKAMYTITKSFHEKVGRGMRLDDALQQAKLAYLQDNGTHLPYFWATMILAGSGEPIAFTPKRAENWWLYTAGIAGILFFGWLVAKKKAEQPCQA